jgi:hypothetical protein
MIKKSLDQLFWICHAFFIQMFGNLISGWTSNPQGVSISD